MSLVQIYKCLCDETRLRIIQMLAHGPLCVCHLQEVLSIPQARVSQHLYYLKQHRLVECQRKGTWMIYSLPEYPSRDLERHLACLQDCTVSDRQFSKDLQKLLKLKAHCTSEIMTAEVKNL